MTNNLAKPVELNLYYKIINKLPAACENISVKEKNNCEFIKYYYIELKRKKRRKQIKMH